MLALFYDTETNGLPLFREPSEDPRQPHIVQLAAHLVDMESRSILQTIDMVARPSGWTIPDDVADIHGLTTDRAIEIGVDESLIVNALMSLWAVAELRIAHNESFDARMVRIALKRFYGDELADEWKAGTAACTCNMATPILSLPPTAKMRAAGRHTPKRANLAEAYRHFFGRDFGGAHTAIADVNACMDVYWAIKDQEGAGQIPEGQILRGKS